MAEPEPPDPETAGRLAVAIETLESMIGHNGFEATVKALTGIDVTALSALAFMRIEDTERAEFELPDLMMLWMDGHLIAKLVDRQPGQGGG